VRSFKEIICVDISEFESSHPSHAVGLLQVRSLTVIRPISVAVRRIAKRCLNLPSTGRAASCEARALHRRGTLPASMTRVGAARTIMPA
jgi:hypothetical protein